jgi:hypothetical protein
VHWFVPSAPGEIDFSAITNGQCGGWLDKVPPKNGAAASPGVVYIGVQGRTDSVVELKDLSINVEQRRPAPTGTDLVGACGGSAGPIRWLTTDLDADRPIVTANFDQANREFLERSDQERTPIKFPYTVSRTDPEIFEVHASTKNCDCLWSATITWISNGQAGTIVVNNTEKGGVPFRTVALTRVGTSCNVRRECNQRQ